MGRALYSTQLYRNQPAVANAQEPAAAENPQRLQYQTWSSIDNNFDPDSEEFFQNAEYEAFVDQPAGDGTRQRDEPETFTEDPEDGSDTDTVSSPSISNHDGDNDSERGSPMAVGTDDPASMIAAAYGSRALQRDEDWDRRRVGGAVGRDTNNTFNVIRAARARLEAARAGTTVRPPIPHIPTQLVNVPTEEIPTTDDHSERTGASTPPMDIPRDPDMPALVAVSPETSPSTSFVWGTPPQPAQREGPFMSSSLGMSPPSSSPRLYTWNTYRRSMASYGSPTATRGSNVSGQSPLTNASARLSVPRIVAPVRVRIEGFAA
jgi:hypothetical protein